MIQISHKMIEIWKADYTFLLCVGSNSVINAKTRIIHFVSTWIYGRLDGPSHCLQKNSLNMHIYIYICRSQWPCGLKRRSAAARLLRFWVRIPPEAWIFVCCECCVLSGRGLCDELITRPEDSYRLCCVVVCDLETSGMRRPWPALGRSATAKKKILVKFSVGLCIQSTELRRAK